MRIICFKLDDKELERLDRIVKLLEDYGKAVSRSDIIRTALKLYINKLEDILEGRYYD